MCHPRLLRMLAVVATLSSAPGATGCSDPLAPFQPEIASSTGNFQLQATRVSSASASRAYAWSNAGTRATIDHSTTTISGTAWLTIRDAAGTVVYDKQLVPSLNEPTAAGVAGLWSIQLRLTQYSGTLNFRVQTL